MSWKPTKPTGSIWNRPTRYGADPYDLNKPVRGQPLEPFRESLAGLADRDRNLYESAPDGWQLNRAGHTLNAYRGVEGGPTAQQITRAEFTAVMSAAAPVERGDLQRAVGTGKLKVIG